MKQKLILVLAAALAVLGFGALPSLASAAEWSVDLEAGSFPTPITWTATDPVLTSSLGTITCESATGTGQYTTPTTGDIQLLFHGCKKGSEVCTTAGQPSGTVTTTDLVFHNIMIDSTVQVTNGKPGVLITFNENHFDTSICGGIFTVKLTGNGIIGEVTNPTCATGTFQKTTTIKFESNATGSQKYKQVETAGTIWDLVADGFGLTATASVDAEFTSEFTNTKAKMTCP